LVIEHRWFNALVDPRLITDLTASQAGGEIFLRPIDSGNASWQALQASGNERLEQLDGPKRQGLTMSACSNRSGLCALLHYPQDAGQRALETQLVISTLGGALGLALFIAVAFLVRQRQTPIYALRRAIDRGLITAVYQPILRLPGQTLYGFEVLARWRDGDGPVLDPESFISLAEQSKLIERITGQMIQQIGRDLGPWLAESGDHRVAINIAPAELLGSRLLSELDRHLLGQGIQPSQILLEITERTMVSSEEAAAAIEALSERGFRVFADDFGIGYCGLSYLNDLRMDGIKISQTFTAALGTDSPKATLVPRIIEMAQQLKLEVIVEGVETQAQLDALQTAAPILVQGWLLGREQPASQLPEILAQLGAG
ncbi:MAG: EAL domain-containing protein, partial [Wenzhouxiangella sp.]|nr:EAL domain-containing protein [Wenzhouxiangella sp.]